MFQVLRYTCFACAAAANVAVAAAAVAAAVAAAAAAAAAAAVGLAHFCVSFVLLSWALVCVILITRAQQMGIQSMSGCSSSSPMQVLLCPCCKTA